MAELKTKENDASVEAFLESVGDPARREDCRRVLEIMSKITKAPAKMCGDSIVGFGNYHYKYKSGREGDWPLVGFSPRKQNLTLYIMGGFDGYEDLMAKLKQKPGKSCLYLKSLDDLPLPTLKELIKRSVASVKQHSSPQR
jgi:hypothetical protein